MGENPPEEYVPEHRGAEETTSRGLLSNKVYDVLKFVAAVVLPALAVLYITVAPYWDLPKQEEVAGTIMAIDLFLGALLGISTSKYKSDPSRFSGKVVFQDTGQAEPDVNLVLNESPKNFEGKDEVVFKVINP